MDLLQIPGAQNTPITIGTEAPTASNICGRVFNAINNIANDQTYTGISICCELLKFKYQFQLEVIQRLVNQFIGLAHTSR